MKHLASTLTIKEVSEKGEFEGYASVFDVVDGGGDVVKAGAFTDSLKERVPKMLLQHDARDVIGVWDEMREDSKGLFARGRLLVDAGVPKADMTHSLMKAGAMDGLSIGFRTIKARPQSKESRIREILEADLWEVSCVTFPMNSHATTTTVKSGFTIRDIEHVLRDAGMDNSFAKKLLSGGYDAAIKSVTQRDAGADEATIASLNDAVQQLRGLT